MMKFIPPFNWSNFDSLTAQLIGPGAEQEWKTECAFGTASNYIIDDDSAEGRFEFVVSNRDLRIAICDCTWTDDHTFVVTDDDWIRFNFSLSIDIEMLLNDSQAVTVNTPSWRIINNPADVIVREIVPGGKRATWVTICCKPEKIEQICGKSLDDMPDYFHDALTPKFNKSFYEYFDFTSRINSITADIVRTKMSGAARLVFIEARCLELLCYSLDFILNSGGDDSAWNLSERENTALTSAKDILLAEFASPPSVAELSRRVGVNRNKLYYGFKQLFGKPISEFIQEQRLEEARRLLRHSELSIAEISQTVGYKHQSNFSASVKRYFGTSPKNLRQ